MTKDPKVSLLVRNLKRAFDHSSWHGPNLMDSLKGLIPAEAAWRPSPQRHNVWELAVHAAYWKYRACRYLGAEAAKSFGIPGSNFFPRPKEETQEAWEADLELLQAWHDRLLEAVASLDGARLKEKPGKAPFTFEDFISGVAAHDLYHAGQIRLLRRLGGFA